MRKNGIQSLATALVDIPAANRICLKDRQNLRIVEKVLPDCTLHHDTVRRLDNKICDEYIRNVSKVYF